MKYLFLDFDGVLNTSNDKDPSALNKKHLEVLNTVVEEHDPNIVISSTWRCFYPLYVLKEILVTHGFKYPDKVVDTTPDLSIREGSRIVSTYGTRGREVGEWIQNNIGIQSESENPISYSICILDDMEPGQFGGLKKYLVMTSMSSGLHTGHIKQVRMMYEKQEPGFRGFK